MVGLDIHASPTTARLPLPPTRLIGRQREVETIVGRLAEPDVRLLTLTGSPGVGKTRLALAAANTAAASFSDGVWLVDLQHVLEPGLLLPTLAAALDVREQLNGSLADALGNHLRDRHALLVLDNVEQLVPAAALLGDLLSACPDLKMLVTSRTPLRVSWEHEYHVHPLRLPTPAEADGASTEALARVPSVALFVSRARAMGAAMRWTRDDLRIMADLCRRLDGLPLALELAAARARVLPLPTLAEHLGQGLDLLSDGPRDWPARHTTLRAAIDWSYRLLPEEQQALFRRLGVFAGGCDLAAAAAVCATDPVADSKLLTALASLADHSLVSSEPDAGAQGLRVHMLVTLSEYARERLAEAGESVETRERHANFYLALAEQATSGLSDGRQCESLRVLHREYENLRAALQWLLHPERSPGDDGLRLAGTLGRFWEASGRLNEGSGWLNLALQRSGPAPSLTRARALNVAGNFARLRGDYAAARASYSLSSEVARCIGDKRAMAMPLANQANVAWDQGDYPSARSAFAAAHDLLVEIGDRRTAAMVQSYVGSVACDQGAYEEAVEVCTAALSEFRALDDWAGVASVLTELGEAAYAQDDVPRALDLFQESLRLRRAQGDLHEMARSLRHVGKSAAALGDTQLARDALGEALELFQRVEHARGIALVLEHLGQLAIAAGDPRRGVRVCSVAAALRAQSRTVLPTADRPRSERALNAARGRVGRRTFDAEWTLGQAASLDDAMRLALAGGDARRAGLTGREREVAALVAEGCSNKHIAAALSISERTVEVHVSNALRKLDVDSRTQLAVWARDNL